MMKKLFAVSLLLAMLFACGDEADKKSDEKTSDTETMSTSKGEDINYEGSEFDVLSFSKSDIPADMYEGDLEYGYKWQDKNGINIAVFTTQLISETKKYEDRVDEEKTLHFKVYHFVSTNGDNWKEIRKIQDRIGPCGDPFGIEAEFIKESISVTDVDNDGYGEITFMYQMLCASELTPYTVKLMLLENGEKYPIRGNNYIEHIYPDSGEKNFGSEFSSAPKALKEHASKTWDKHCKVNPAGTKSGKTSDSGLSAVAKRNAPHLSGKTWRPKTDVAGDELYPAGIRFYTDGRFSYTMMSEDWLESSWNMPDNYRIEVPGLTGHLWWQEGFLSLERYDGSFYYEAH